MNQLVEEKEQKNTQEISRSRKLVGQAALVVALIAISMSIFQFYSAGFRMLPAMQHRAIHLSFALVLSFLLYPGSKGQHQKISFLDYLFAILSIAIGLYLVIEYKELIYRAGDPIFLDLLMGFIALFLVLEATRRVMGWPIVIVALAFLFYAYFGPYMPSAIAHKGYTLKRIIDHMYLTTQGIYGVAIYVSSTFVFTFVLFGALLEATGGSQFFIDFAFALTGRHRGGPAKAAVLSSGLMGMISGSAFANVITTGTFTIPLMKSVGYSPVFAGAVEAAASAGGQIAPPVMGAAAFIMAEMLGISYGKLIIYAALPALLYFLAVGVMVDFRAGKLGISGVSKEKLPKLIPILKKGGHLIFPPIAIIYFLVVGYTPIKASFYAIIITFIASMFRKETRLTPKRLMIAFEKGATNALSIVAACAAAGIIVGVVTLTGLGLKFASLIVDLSAGNLMLALFLTMISCIIFGMGMPTTALYVILATLVAPALVRMGVIPVAAHLFIFYFGVFAALTPPVALSSYLAASIAKADGVKTALAGLKLALAAFLMPYIFALSPSLLLIDTSIGKILWILFTSLLGIFSLAGSIEGYFLIDNIDIPKRLVLFVSALSLIVPTVITDTIGFAGVGLVSISMMIRKAKQRREEKG
ncbi:MAG: TRAP transporter permease [Candidatus Atribacteria bacterium]|nr:TRAP transporter permease [Candidatus Atribacteria bacterium]